MAHLRQSAEEVVHFQSMMVNTQETLLLTFQKKSTKIHNPLCDIAVTGKNI
jgi:hypothetical protein